MKALRISFSIARIHIHVYNYNIFKESKEPFRERDSDSVFEFYILVYYVTISKDVMDNFLWKSS